MRSTREWAMILISLEVVLSMMVVTDVIVSPARLDILICATLVVTTILDLVLFVRKDRATNGRW